MTKLELVADRLETRGLRVTAARRAVLAAVVAAGPHFTVDEVCRRARGVGRATVFRTMRLLQRLNVVCRVLMEDGSLHYRLRTTRGHHHHLVCTECGHVETLANCDVSGLVKEVARRTNYQVEGHWFEVYGRCRACRSQPPAEEARAPEDQGGVAANVPATGETRGSGE